MLNNNQPKVNIMYLRYTSKHPLPHDVLSCAPNQHKIIFLVKGKADCIVEKSEYSLKPGQLIVINDKETHELSIDTNEFTEFVEIRFSPSDRYIEAMDVENLLHCFIHRPRGERNRINTDKYQSDRIWEIINKIQYYDNNTGYGFPSLKLTSFIELLVTINTIFINTLHTDTESANKIPEKLVQVLDYIENNLSGDLSLEKLINTFFMDKFHLCRQFKKYTGYSLHKYIILKRVFKAKSLLREGVNVTSACFMSGFNDYSHFVRIFKKITGMSPLKYAKLYLNKVDINEANEYYSMFIKSYPETFGLPDLIIADILWSPQNPCEGDDVIFSAVIKNIGTGSTPAGVILGVGFCIGFPTYSWSDNHVLPLAPGESITLPANGGCNGANTWSATAGVHILTAFVDDVCRIKEVTRENNKLTKTFIVEKK